MTSDAGARPRPPSGHGLTHGSRMRLITRRHALVCGALTLTVSPVIATGSFIAAALLSAVDGWRQLSTRRNLVTLGVILLLSAWFWHQKVLPERFGPGTVSFTDYVTFYFFLLALSLTPFTTREIKSFTFAFLATAPQQFLVAVGERYWGWTGRFYFPARRMPIIDIYVGPSEPELATSGSFFNPTIFALYGLMVLILSISLLLDESGGVVAWSRSRVTKPRTLGLAAGMLCGVVLLVWTGSRNAWFFLMLVLFVFSRFPPRRLFLALGLGMALLTLLAFHNAFFPTSVMHHVLPEALTSKLTVFSADRARYYQIAWRLIEEKPWTGWGIGTFPRLVPAQLLGYEVLHTHSLPLQLALEVGVPAAVAVLSLMGSLAVVTARGILRRERFTGIVQPLDRGLLLAFVVILLMQVFDLALLMTYRLQFLFWLCLAVPYSRCRILPDPRTDGPACVLAVLRGPSAAPAHK